MKTLLMASTILGVISPVPVTAQHGYTLMCNRQEIQNNYIDAGGGFVYPINLEGTDGKPVHSGVSFINCVSTETSELNIYTEDRLCNLMLEVKESHQE
ncbi:hypothetical protein FACS1894166_10480 [Bacilli bacterium]|nr:hypothetical protein FACS1894166_10480 [Bacilli bacterium]